MVPNYIFHYFISFMNLFSPDIFFRSPNMSYESRSTKNYMSPKFLGRHGADVPLFWLIKYYKNKPQQKTNFGVNFFI